MPTGAVLVLLAITGVFIAVIIAHPGVTADRGGKILAFLGLLFLTQSGS